MQAAEGEPSALGRWRRLLPTLPWLRFAHKCLGLAVRAGLILSIYTSAAIFSARLGTVSLAAHQVVQQLQQLQLAMTWAFLSVGQALVSSVYREDATSAAAARALGSRVVLWAAFLALALAVATWAARGVLPALFVKGCASTGAVLDAIAPAVLPACAMLVFSCNNGIEGVLLGAGDTRFVVGMYPPSVLLGLGCLAVAWVSGGGLAGVWYALAAYYCSLMLLFGLRWAAPLRWMRGPLHLGAL